MEFSFEYRGRKLIARRTVYAFGDHNQPAILVFDEDDEECSLATGMPYGVLTVNLDDPRNEIDDETMVITQYVAVNDWPGIAEALADVDWCQDTGWFLQSGFVEFPLYRFDMRIPTL